MKLTIWLMRWELAISMLRFRWNCWRYDRTVRRFMSKIEKNVAK